MSLDTSDYEKGVKSASASGEKLADDLDKLSDAAKNTSGGFTVAKGVLANFISGGVTAAVSAVGNLASTIWNLDEATAEHSIAMGRLNTAYEAAGYGADTAQQAFTAFYGILGDTDTATEASQLLAKLADSAEDVSTWTDIAAGVSGTFGDSLPIESLIEAANETARVGEVTGTLADALNWAGEVGEDEFNAMLAECSSEAERNQLIMDTLAGTYGEAADAFYANNEALVAGREGQVQMQNSLAELGTAIGNVKTGLLNEFSPALSAAASAVIPAQLLPPSGRTARPLARTSPPSLTRARARSRISIPMRLPHSPTLGRFSAT